MKVGFAERPSIGTAIMISGQRYDLIGTVDHQKPDGSTVELLGWSTNCAVCDAEMVVKSKPLSLPENRRCPAHAAPGKRIKKG